MGGLLPQHGGNYLELDASSTELDASSTGSEHYCALLDEQTRRRSSANAEKEPLRSPAKT
jgi:hypothetical protein